MSLDKLLTCLEAVVKKASTEGGAEELGGVEAATAAAAAAAARAPRLTRACLVALAGGAPPPREADGAAARAEEAATQAALEHTEAGEEESGALSLLAPLLPRVLQLCHHPHVLVPGVCAGPWRGVCGALERWCGEEQP